jgi:hypothetical protein
MKRTPKPNNLQGGASYINRLNKIKVLNIIRTTENLNKENLLGQYDDDEPSKNYLDFDGFINYVTKRKKQFWGTACRSIHPC